MVTQAGPLDREACYARRNEGNGPFVGYQSLCGTGGSEIVIRCSLFITGHDSLRDAVSNEFLIGDREFGYFSKL
jgi:hypothetical protein